MDKLSYVFQSAWSSFLWLACWAALPTLAVGTEYAVAPGGSDDAPGTLDAPLRTIQKAADVMEPGDTCYVRAGVYHESVELRRSGRPDAPIRFAAYPGEVVVLDGAELIEGPWTLHKGAIYKTRTRRRFEQLFVNRQMMFEARWPNITFDKLLTREGWASAGPGSTYQKLRDPELAAKVIALRLGSPPKGYSNWSLRLLAEHVAELGLVDSISHETIRQTLKKRDDQAKDPILGDSS